MERSFETKQIETFSITRIHETIIQYEPIIISKEYCFSEPIKIINQQNFESLSNKKYDKENNWYILSAEEQAKNKYFYPDFDRESQWSLDELRNADWEYDYNNPTHDPRENPWIDVLGAGDDAETAYWNTD